VRENARSVRMPEILPSCGHADVDSTRYRLFKTEHPGSAAYGYPDLFRL